MLREHVDFKGTSLQITWYTSCLLAPPHVSNSAVEIKLRKWLSAENALWFVGLSNPSCRRAPGFNNNTTGAHETMMEKESRCKRMGSATDRCGGNLALQLVNGMVAICCQFPVCTATGKQGAAVKQTRVVGNRLLLFPQHLTPRIISTSDKNPNSVTRTRARSNKLHPQFMDDDYRIETGRLDGIQPV